MNNILHVNSRKKNTVDFFINFINLRFNQLTSRFYSSRKKEKEGKKRIDRKQKNF